MLLNGFIPFRPLLVSRVSLVSEIVDGNQCDKTLKYKVAQNLPNVAQKEATEVYT